MCVTAVAFLIRRKLNRDAEKTDLEIKHRRIDLEIKLEQYRETMRRNSQVPEQKKQIRDDIERLALVASQDEAPANGEPQALTCMLFVESETSRAESISDRIGDIVLGVTGGDPARKPGRYAIDISLNVNCTNGISDEQLVAVEWIDAGGGRQETAHLIHNNRVRFPEVQIASPGTSHTDQYRIAGLRVNTSQLGRRVGKDDSVLGFVTIEALDTKAPRVAIANNLVSLVRPILGLISSESSPLTYEPSETGPLNPHLLDPKTRVSSFFDQYISLSEGFPAAFRTHQEESPRDSLRGADCGTRFLIRFFNLPENLRVFVSLYDVVREQTRNPRDTWADRTRASTEVPCTLLVSGANSDGAGGTLAATSSNLIAGEKDVPMREVELAGGFGFAVYEWIGGIGSRLTIREVYLGMSFATSVVDDVPRGSGQVCATLAPISTVTTATGSAPIPRFIDVGGDPSTIVSQLGPRSTWE